MSAKHTPGPWAASMWADDVVGAVGWSIGEGNTGYRVPMSTFETDDEEVAEANARLIAAAPDLLGALQVVVADWTAQFERNGHLAPAWCKQARVAIAKATGEAA